MVRQGLPTGGMGETQGPSVNGQYFPSRGKLSADLTGTVDPYGYSTKNENTGQIDSAWAVRRFLGANKGYLKYDRLAAGYGDDEDVARALGLGSRVAGTYYSGDDQDADTVEGIDDNSSVAITQIPTSSTDYQRPRTVAAGYDEERQTMTVVFRDGTFYNYYDVSPTEWEAFSASFSKGRPWLNRANKNQGADGLFVGKPRGVADVSVLPEGVKRELYRVASAWQIHSKPRAHRYARNERRLDPTGGRRVGNYKKRISGKY